MKRCESQTGPRRPMFFGNDRTVIDAAFPRPCHERQIVRRPEVQSRTMLLVRRVLFTPLALLFVVRLVAAPTVRLPDLDNRLVDPFLAAESSKAIVFLFASVDCPVSNRYAPVVQRLHQPFPPQGL